MSDLLETLKAKLGLDSPDKAEAMAGWGVGSVQEELKKVPSGKELSKKVGASMPDLDKWKKKAKDMLGDEKEGEKEKKGGLAGLMSMFTPKKKEDKGPSGSIANPLDIMGVLENDTMEKVKSSLPFFGSGNSGPGVVEQVQEKASEAMEGAKDMLGKGKKK
eukprot:jgi/Pico_ML_1/55770/g1413.t2